MATHRCIGAAKGLAYLESKNILHRDVALRCVDDMKFKLTRNLLAIEVDGEYTAKVSDFGMSRATPNGEYSLKTDRRIPVKWTSPEGRCL